jgi:hypothetical protein
MNMPGFTAEASLHRTNVHYHALNEQRQAGGIVHPAQFESPFWVTSPSRPVPPWYKYVFTPFCRVKIKKAVDWKTRKDVELCEMHCPDGSVWPCEL